MTLQETNMNGSQFNRTTLENVSFQGVSLKAAKFIQTNLRHISFEKTDLSQATFLACEFFEVRFDDDTKLPFSKERALLLGMTYVPKTN